MVSTTNCPILPCLIALGLSYVEGVRGPGYYANDGTVPYQVSIHTGDDILCGGVIYDAYTVITAAHCLVKNNKAKAVDGITVYTGSAYRFKGQTSVAYKTVAHPGYNEFGLIHDIGLIRLFTPLTFSTNVKPVKLAKPGTHYSTGTCVISGFGYMTKAKELADQLRTATVKLRDPEVCENDYQGYNRDLLVCAGGTGGTGPCQGDSGGPLICKQEPEDELYGITESAPVSCSGTVMAGVYTNIPAYYNWIIKVAKILPD